MGKQYHSSFILLVVVKLVCCGMSDFASDQAECGNALVGLAPCIEYATGDAKAPTPDCCKGLQQLITKSPKCLCILIKDRNDPNLGFKINATKALTLPTTCKTTAVNTSECIGKMNESANAGGTSAKEKSKGTKGRWVSNEKITGLVLMCFWTYLSP